MNKRFLVLAAVVLVIVTISLIQYLRNERDEGTLLLSGTVEVTEGTPFAEIARACSTLGIRVDDPEVCVRRFVDEDDFHRPIAPQLFDHRKQFRCQLGDAVFFVAARYHN
jgi:hypothetical protein